MNDILFIAHPNERMHPDLKDPWYDNHRPLNLQDTFPTVETDDVDINFTGTIFYMIYLRDLSHLSMENVGKIDTKILELLQSGEVKLLINQSNEEFDFFSINDYREAVENKWPTGMIKNLVYNTGIGKLITLLGELKIKQENCHYCSSFLYEKERLSELKSLGVNIDIHFHFKDLWMEIWGAHKSLETHTILKPSESPLLFCALNAGRRTPFKTGVIYKLWQTGLLDLGRATLSSFDKDVLNEEDYDPEFLKLLPIASHRKNFNPNYNHTTGGIIYDHTQDKGSWINSNANVKNKQTFHIRKGNQLWDQEYHEVNDCKIYISTESLIDCNYCYITEKTWRAITNRKPFLIIGNKNSLQKLKDLGFRTFSDWWDESYDNLECFGEQCRINKVIEIVQDLSTKPNSYFQGLEEITEHNYNVFTKTNWTQDAIDSLKKAVLYSS
jgi:hypothetical protein